MRRPFRSVLTPLITTGLGLALFAGVQARQPAPAPATPVAPAPATVAAPPVPLMWKVGNGTTHAYLLGSFHLLKPDDYPLSPDIDAALADVQSVTFELAPSEMNSPQLGMQMGLAAMRTDGTTLDSELPEATRAQLAAWMSANTAELAKSGMSPTVLQGFKPWFVSLIVTLVEMGKMGLDPKLGLDAHMAARATETGKVTNGLETGAEQVALFADMSQRQGLEFLQEALSQTANGSAEMEALHTAWRMGDDARLWNDMAVDMRTRFPELYKSINVDRNDAWVPKIEARLADAAAGNALYVVGSLHLVGEDGVVEKLRAKGFTVERVCSACAATPSVPTGPSTTPAVPAVPAVPATGT